MVGFGADASAPNPTGGTDLPVARVLSGVQPSGDPHVGTYLGAWRRWAEQQQPDHVFCIVDLHAMTSGHDPALLRERTLDCGAWLLASGLDPEVATLFVQSHRPEHAELSWVLECVASYGELSRMVQFKEKSATAGESVSVGLFTYPVLQAADILLYHAEEVPVGADQRQHIELTRTLAERFNQRFGEVFTRPKATFPPAGARVMDLTDPTRKMSKSVASPAGTILLSDPPEDTRKKIMRAVTDSGSEIRPGEDKPGVTNLLELYASATGEPVETVAARHDGEGYGALKRATAEALNTALAPVRDRYAELRDDPAQLEASLREGARAAGETAGATLASAREALGLLAR